METKSIIEELEKINDINILSDDELIKKYLVSKEKYKEFLTNYGDFFTKGVLYQVRTVSNYKKIGLLLEKGNKLYVDEENEEIQRKMLETIDFILNKYRTKDLVQDELQLKYIFKDIVGANMNKEDNRYENIVSGILDALKKYNNCDGNSIGDFVDYAAFNLENDSSMEQSKYDTAISKYIKEHNMAQLCNNVNFLYLVNYMLKFKKNYVSQEFIRDSKEIIGTSLLFDAYSLPNKNRNVSDKNYKRVARYTLKNIFRYQKSNSKIEEIQLKKR